MNRLKTRDTIQWFATNMEVRLRVNSEKGGWKCLPTDWLIARIERHLATLRSAVTQTNDQKPRTNAAEITRIATDLANYAMMIADNCKE